MDGDEVGVGEQGLHVHVLRVLHRLQQHRAHFIKHWSTMLLKTTNQA